MTQQLTEDPKVTVRDLLRANWDPANTSGITPAISTGWYDGASANTQVSVADPDDSEIGGGDTGLEGIQAGGGHVQARSGFVRCHCWVHRDMEDVDAAGVNPKTLAWQFRQEIFRIVLANVLTPGDPVMDNIAPGASTEVTDADEAPTLYRRIVNVVYAWRAMS